MKEQIEKIDNVLITASIALLAAFVILYSLQDKQNVFFGLLTLVAITFLVFYLLLALYSKYRDSLRKDIFEHQKDKWLSDFSKDLDKMMDDWYTPQLLEFTKTVLTDDVNKKEIVANPTRIPEILEMEIKKWHKDTEVEHQYVRNLFAENHKMRLNKILDGSFSGPLQEKNAIIKHQIEIFSKNRFNFFIFGLLAFIISVGIKLFT